MNRNAKNQPETDFPNLAQPALRALLKAGYTSLEEVSEASEDEIKNLHGMGPNAMGKLREALKARGLTFARG